MREELRAVFGREVDLVEERLIDNPYRRHNILLDKRVLFPPQRRSFDSVRDGANRFERDVSLVFDILNAGRDILEATESKTFDDCMADRILRFAVERLLITIGEASRGFSAAFRAAHPEIPWSDIIGERNILVHQYEKIEHDQVWRIATVDVPRLLRELRPLLPPAP